MTCNHLRCWMLLLTAWKQVSLYCTTCTSYSWAKMHKFILVLLKMTWVSWHLRAGGRCLPCYCYWAHSKCLYHRQPQQMVHSTTVTVSMLVLICINKRGCLKNIMYVWGINWTELYLQEFSYALLILVFLK